MMRPTSALGFASAMVPGFGKQWDTYKADMPNNIAKPSFSLDFIWSFQIIAAGRIERNASHAPLKAVCAQPRYYSCEQLIPLREPECKSREGGNSQSGHTGASTKTLAS